MSIESQASKLCTATGLMDDASPYGQSARAGKRAHSVRQDGSRPHGAVIPSPVAQWWHKPILQGLARLTSCSPEEKLSVAKTWPDMLLPVATTPGPRDGQGPLSIATVLFLC